MALRSTPKKAKRRGRPGPVADRSGAITGLETWYHGGKPGLGVAAVLKPRNMLADWAGKTVRYRTASPIDRKAEEYLAVTQDLDLARYYASIYVGPTDHHEPGDVYSVRLYSHPQIDPDHDRFFPRVAHTGPSTVIAVIETGVVLSPTSCHSVPGPVPALGRLGACIRRRWLSSAITPYAGSRTHGERPAEVRPLDALRETHCRRRSPALAPVWLTGQTGCPVPAAALYSVAPRRNSDRKAERGPALGAEPRSNTRSSEGGGFRPRNQRLVKQKCTISDVPLSTPLNESAICSALSTPRMSTYLFASSGNPQTAVELYGWNGMVSAALMVPAHFAEVVTRNLVDEVVTAAYGAMWPWDNSFTQSLPSPKTAFNPRRHLTQTREGFTSTGKVIAELKFVFWQSIFTSRHDTRLWSTRLANSLPGATEGSTDSDLRKRIYDDLETIRRVRNRVAHHEPIFNRDLQKDLNRMLELIELRSPETAAWVRQLEDVSSLLLQRPH